MSDFILLNIGNLLRYHPMTVADGSSLWFIISKVLLTLMLPPASILLLLLAGFMIGRKHPGCGKLFVALAVVFLYLLSIPISADMLIRPLESAYSPFDDRSSDAAAVVVLGGGIQDLSWVPSRPRLSETALVRLVNGVELARAFRLPLVVAGGNGAIDGSTLAEADAMADRAVRLGIPAKNIILENKSRNTWENALGLRDLLTVRKIILVTSAFHMKRAAGMFKKQGFDVIPAPAGFRSETRHASWTNLLPRSEHLETSTLAISEYLSMFWYRLAGAL